MKIFKTDEEFYSWWDEGYEKAMGVDWIGWGVIVFVFILIVGMGITILFMGCAL